MIYLYYGTESFLIKKAINKIIDDLHIESINITTYDLDIEPVDRLIDDAQTISMFDDQKLIIGSNASFLTAKSNPIHNLELLEEYLKDPSLTTTIIFTVDADKLDERKKIVKLLKEKAKVTSFSKSNDVTTLVKEMFETYKIDNATLNCFIKRVGTNLGILFQEANKLKSYKMEEKEITIDDVTALASENVEGNIFDLVDAIVLKNKETAMNIYHNLTLLGEEPIKILILLANQFRLLYQTKRLILRGYTDLEIANLLEVHPYPVKLARSKCKNYQEEELLSYLNQLADLDYDIKTGKINSDAGLELFILSM